VIRRHLGWRKGTHKRRGPLARAKQKAELKAKAGSGQEK